MIFSPRKPKVSRQAALAIKPIRLPGAAANPRADGGANLKVPLGQRRWAGRLLRLPDGTAKTFELDPLGLLIWNACDGKTSVQQMIRALARQYQFNLREAEVATLSFLNTLVKKGLIGMPLKDARARKPQ